MLSSAVTKRAVVRGTTSRPRVGPSSIRVPRIVTRVAEPERPEDAFRTVQERVSTAQTVQNPNAETICVEGDAVAPVPVGQQTFTVTEEHAVEKERVERYTEVTPVTREYVTEVRPTGKVIEAPTTIENDRTITREVGEHTCFPTGTTTVEFKSDVEGVQTAAQTTQTATTGYTAGTQTASTGYTATAETNQTASGGFGTGTGYAATSGGATSATYSTGPTGMVSERTTVTTGPTTATGASYTTSDAYKTMNTSTPASNLQAARESAYQQEKQADHMASKSVQQHIKDDVNDIGPDE